jgi:enamine deaminase RidA (YjgF/YER057c/UK114 family)
VVRAARKSKVIFTKIRNLLEAAGGAMADVVKVTIFVTDIRNREQVWRARREFFTGNFPASTLVEVGRWPTLAQVSRDRLLRPAHRVRTRGLHFSSEMEAGPGVTSVGHCGAERHGRGRNAFVPRRFGGDGGARIAAHQLVTIRW